MLVTIFLVVLIIALVLGNILLGLLKPSKQLQQQGYPAQSAQSQKKTSSVFKSSAVFEEAAEKERIGLLNKRIDRLESLLLKINGTKFLGKKLNGTVLGQKLVDFNEFKDNTKLEIAALKQELARVKNQLGIKERKNPGEDYPISDEKLHELVFQPTTGKS